MRKIINSAFVSLDGVTADPGSWASGYFDQQAAGQAAQALRGYDGMLMGRGTYEYFAEDMPTQTGPYADAIDEVRFTVFPLLLGRQTGGTGNGLTLRLTLVEATPYPSGAVGLTYTPVA